MFINIYVIHVIHIISITMRLLIFDIISLFKGALQVQSLIIFVVAKNVGKYLTNLTDNFFFKWM